MKICRFRRLLRMNRRVIEGGHLGVVAPESYPEGRPALIVFHDNQFWLRFYKGICLFRPVEGSHQEEQSPREADSESLDGTG